MSCWEQALWMGDVLADKDYVLTVSDGTGSANVSIAKGSWWANAIIFWAWVQDQSGENLNLDVTFDSTNQWARFTSMGSTYSFDEDGSMVTEVAGFAQTSGSDFWEVGNIFLPSYPVSLYDIGNNVFGATSTRTMTGASTTVVGIVQPTRRIRMQFASGEVVKWRALWSTHFSKGRSCTFWHDNLPTTAIDPFLAAQGAVDQLVVEASLSRWQGQRTVEYRNIALQDEDAIEYRRRPNVPLSEPGLQSWYIPPTPAW